MKRKHTMRAFIYLTIGLAMLFYALPHLPDVTLTLKGAFTTSWLLFAMLIIGANLYYLIGADRDQQQEQKQRLAWSDRMANLNFRRGSYTVVKQKGKQEGRRRRSLS